MEALKDVARELALLIPTIAAALAAAVGWLRSDREWVRRLGCVALPVVLFTLCWQVTGVWQRRTSLRAIASERMAPFSAEDPLSEVSGAAVLDGSLFVVGDESSTIYEVRRRDEEAGYAIRLEAPLGIDVSDLEAAEAHAGRLYLITSHSNTRKGKAKADRRWLLEVRVNGRPEVTRRQSKLREPILAFLRSRRVGEFTNLEGKAEVMDIEGLAIDEAGTAYLGFRAPTPRASALILRAPLESLFASPPSGFELFRVDLRAAEPPGEEGHASENGITGMAFDPVTRRIAILGNAPHRAERHTPRLWLLDPSSLDPQSPTRPHLCAWEFSDRWYPGKPEALALWPVSRPEGWIARLRERLLGVDGDVEVFYDVSGAPSVGQRFRRKELCPELARRAEG